MADDTRFASKRILITGSAGGIGFAAASLFARSGARVVINDLAPEALDQALDRLREEKLECFGVEGTVAHRAGCEAIVEQAIARLGGLDVLVNCAGIYRQGPSVSFDEDEWDRTLDVNLKGTFFTTMAAMQHLRQSRGNVVNLASEAGLRGAKMSAVYCASKGGVVLLTKALALEFAPEVRVNCICPGAVNTTMMSDVAEASGDAVRYMNAMKASYPLDRIAEPVEIAQSILYLASRDAANITGSALAIDGGSTAGR